MKTLSLYFLLLLVFISGGAYAQKKVFKGRVVDAESNKPLEFVSVYITNSTIGTLTNNTGGFSFTLDPGKYEVVVSMVGYGPIIHPIIIKNDETAMAPVLFKIPQQAYALDAVSVTGKRDASWYANLRLFKDFFLGKSAIAQKCKLLNPDALVTEFNVEKQTLTVTAKEPLKIQNPELGYNINFLLVAFVLNKNEGYVSYLGYPHFEPMDGSESKKRQWIEKRLEVFQGSSMHFARSLRDQKLQQEGFRVTRSMTYEDVAYEEYLSYLDNEAKVEFKGSLNVVYLRKMEDLDYVYSKNTGVRKASYQTSTISLKDSCVLIDKTGRFEKPLGIIFDGYWSWDKVGDMLPFDYNP
ncbi:carboxypeptidase-like regulatory domain-containing protein [Dyadobacter subterraneus]|uniref:Carboxypeptidase-like regulatory domain-containing protein n=1 Tax=Dyadobacter subterraneus TaxID=2773304 RepID=A0ABR9WAR7_9BACT|nr:carboxypeptidase-like regulatory domain-containing protein [Dyadobacter subterraneus]MBE9462563.1 carboxypeptidase-like regulatory domain-containing protein [Dyadobacter subterraneus]